MTTQTNTKFRRRRPDPAPDPAGDLEGVSAVPLRHHLDRRAGELAASVSDDDPEELLTTSDVAEWLGLSTQWLEIGRSRGYGPAFVRLSPRRVRYLRASVLDWLRERQFHATAEYHQA